MTAITRIELRILTGDRTDAGANGDVYLGLAGREFHVDSDANDFERGSDRTYIFGDGHNVTDQPANDPRTPWQIDSDDIGRCPRYIRLEESNEEDNVTWNVEFVHLEVTFGDSSFIRDRLGGNANLWMGAGKNKFQSRYLYFS